MISYRRRRVENCWRVTWCDEVNWLLAKRRGERALKRHRPNDLNSRLAAAAPPPPVVADVAEAKHRRDDGA